MLITKIKTGTSTEVSEYIKQYNNSIKIINDCKPHINDENDATPLMVLCARGYEDEACALIETLGNNVNISHKDKRNNTALSLACKNKLTKVINIIINDFGNKCEPHQPDDNDIPPIMYLCCKETEYLAIKMIHKFGKACNISYILPQNETILDIAFAKNLNDLIKVLIPNYYTIINPSVKIGNKFTTLMIACLYCDNHTNIKLLMETYGDKCMPTTKTTNGMTALMYACVKKKYDVAIEMINIYGEKCNFNCVNKNNKYFIDYVNDDYLRAAMKAFTNCKTKRVSLKEPYTINYKCCICFNKINDLIVVNPCSHV